MADRETELTGRTTRRGFVKRAGAGAGGLLLSGVAAQPVWARPRSYDAGNTIKIGFVSPLTGPAAGFGEPDPYVIGLARKAFAKGLTIGGQHYAVEIHEKDSQSAPQRAAQVASDLIHGTNVDLMLATSTPEVVNPVSDASEAAGTPCISTVVPWESWYFGRGAKPGKPSPFRYTYHFCFGVANFADTYEHLWTQVKTNKKVGVMWPNDADGNAIRANLGPLLEKAGYTIIDPGAYQDGTNDYSAQISKFKQEGVQIFNTFPIPPDFATFWRQAAQQGLTKQIKIAQIAKTGLFVSQVSALGSLGFNLASGAYWGPTWPYRSSLTGITNKQLGAGYEKHSGKYWNQQAGPSLALFDVAAAALKASGDPKNKDKVAAAMKTLNVMTPVGELHWGQKGKRNPVPNVVATPIPGGQWVKGSGKYKYEWVFCEHSDDPKVPIQAKLKPYTA
ncbi:MAG TPA: ABC transporter substrate-binding protein [Gaiellaceae bacterium]|nr:ABC transporter substrate-binding protein [Gaiellaceae bacterium]